MVKNLPVNAVYIKDESLIPGLGGSPGGGFSIHFSILAWKIPWTQEPGGLQSMGSQRVGHNRACMYNNKRHTLLPPNGGLLFFFFFFFFLLNSFSSVIFWNTFLA